MNNSIYSSFIDFEVDLEIKRLNNLIIEEETKYSEISEDYQKLKNEVDKFIDFYYGSLAHLFKQLKIDEPKKNIQEKAPDVKELYLQLAKDFHPDIIGEPTLFQEIKEAYDNNDFFKLNQIKVQYKPISEPNNEILLQTLTNRYDFLVATNARIENDHKKLVQSDEYKLMKQYNLAKFDGYDLIEKVKNELEKIILYQKMDENE